MNFRKKSLWWFLCLSLVMALAIPCMNHTISASAAEQGSQVSAQLPEKAAAGGGTAGGTTGEKGTFSIIWIYALILALFIAIPTLTDICKAYKAQQANWKLLIGKLIDTAGKDKLDKDELTAILKATSEGPPGISGMSRSLMAFAVILILGIAVFHLLATCTTDCEGMKIVNNIMNMLAATLASITGFYFGGRSAEAKGAEKTARVTKPGAGGDGDGGADGDKEARLKAEQEAKKKAEEEARLKTEEDAKKNTANEEPVKIPLDRTGIEEVVEALKKPEKEK